MNDGATARIHHLGIVCRDMEQALREYQALGFVPEGPPVEDAVQRVTVAFLQGAAGSRIELVVPAGPDSPVQAFLDNGGGLHHVCYQVPDLDRALADLENRRFLVVRQPVEACGLGGCRIAFAYSKNMQLIEFVEMEP